MGRKLAGAKTPSPKGPTDVRGLAQALGITYQQARRLRLNGLEIRQDGTFDLDEARQRLTLQAERAHQWAGIAPEDQALKRRQANAKAVLLELEVSEAYKRLVPRNDVVVEWRTKVLAVKNSLKRLGRELAPRVAHRGPQECQAIIDLRVMELLRLYSHPEFYHDVSP